jgi:hypothetical protein
VAICAVERLFILETLVIRCAYRQPIVLLTISSRYIQLSHCVAVVGKKERNIIHSVAIPFILAVASST